MVRRRQVLWSAVAVALLLALGSALAQGGFRRYFKLNADVHALKAHNERMAEENARLRQEVDALRDDDRAIERAAREELGFVRPGEIVFTLEDK